MRKFILSFVFLFTISSYAQTEVTFYTNYGDFTIELHDTLMPITTTNFIGLVNNKGYDGKRFYRVIANFVIQGGYRTGLPPSIPDEFDSTGTLSNRRWTLSMANSGPNTGSSEFFINLKDNIFLDYDNAPLTSAHPVFGTTVSGYAEILAIAGVPVDANDQPNIPVTMDSVRVTSTPLSQDQFSINALQSALYPNPVSEESILDLYSAFSQLTSIQLVDVNGKVLFETVRKVNSGKNMIPLNELGIDQLETGSYFLLVGVDGEEQVFKISKN